jgi:hypothetical protein
MSFESLLYFLQLRILFRGGSITFIEISGEIPELSITSSKRGYIVEEKHPLRPLKLARQCVGVKLCQFDKKLISKNFLKMFIL